MIILSRDCEAVLVPDGTEITLSEGTRVRLTQNLGGRYTVVSEQGPMASISAEDADALGIEIEEKKEEEKKTEFTEEELKEEVWKQLKTCYDPEIPHNIVDLGLVYECNVASLECGNKKVDIQMTLTAPGCGMGDWLADDVKKRVSSISVVDEVNVEIVFEPAWDRSKMSPALKRQLNM